MSDTRNQVPFRLLLFLGLPGLGFKVLKPGETGERGLGLWVLSVESRFIVLGTEREAVETKLKRDWNRCRKRAHNLDEHIG